MAKSTTASPLHFAIDGNEANVSQRVGSNVYAFKIIEQLEVLTEDQPQLQVTVLLRRPPVKDLPKPRSGWQYQVVKPSLLWTQLAAPIHLFLNSHRYDLFFTPGHYAPRLSAVPYVSSVMDLAFLQFPDQFHYTDLIQLKHWTKYSVKKARRVVTISDFSKADLIKQYHLPAEKIDVVYPAVEPESPASNQEVAAFFKKHRLRKPYFIFVGTFQPRKNLQKLVAAYELFCRQISSQQVFSHSRNRSSNGQSGIQLPQLVLAGKSGWLADDILQRIKQSPFYDYIILPGFVPDNLKPALYERAVASILVGLHEGFGIPALESLHYDCLPIVSNQSSLPEVVGEAGILVDPKSEHSIAQGLKLALEYSAHQVTQFRRQAAQQRAKFDWQQSAQQILNILIDTAQEQTSRHVK